MSWSYFLIVRSSVPCPQPDSQDRGKITIYLPQFCSPKFAAWLYYQPAIEKHFLEWTWRVCFVPEKESLNIGNFSVLLKTEPRALHMARQISSISKEQSFFSTLKINIFDLGSRLKSGSSEKYLDRDFLPIFGSKIPQFYSPGSHWWGCLKDQETFTSSPGSDLKTGWRHFWACPTQPCHKLFHSLASLSLSLSSLGASFLPCDVTSQYFPSVPQVLRGAETTSLCLLRNPCCFTSLSLNLGWGSADFRAYWVPAKAWAITLQRPEAKQASLHTAGKGSIRHLESLRFHWRAELLKLRILDPAPPP